MMPCRFLVAVHDVTPAHAERLQRIYELLGRGGIDRPALFVVPNWHGTWPLDEHASFVADLGRRVEAGAEVFLHGYRHDEVGHRRSVADRLRVFGRTAASAEFLFLSEEEARRRIDKGLALFRTVGLEPVGFVPPAWLFAGHTRRMARDRGLHLTESFLWLENTETGDRRFAPALSWSTARNWRSRATAALGDVRSRVAWPQPVIRISIHPPDVDVPAVRQSLERVVAHLASTRSFRTYRELLGTSAASG
jgi:predicted deacetylase